MNSETVRNEQNEFYDPEKSGESFEKFEKKGGFSSFFRGNSKSGKIPLLLLVCGALGLFLAILGSGEHRLFGASNPPSATVSGANEKKLRTELSGLLAEAEGVGNNEIYLTFGADGGLQGVAVLCEGGEDPLVQKRVLRLLSALYGIGTHRIYVGGLHRRDAPPAAEGAAAGEDVSQNPHAAKPHL